MDFSPITLTTYAKDSTSISSYNSQFILTDRNTTIRDKKNRITETLEYDKNLTLISREVNEYHDQQNEIIIKSYDGKGKLKPNKTGVAIRVQKSYPKDENESSEERFYDVNNKLIDGNHDCFDISGFTYSYSIIRRGKLNAYFNSKNKLQFKSDGLGTIIR